MSAALAPTGPLAWEPPYAEGAALKKKKAEKKEKERKEKKKSSDTLESEYNCWHFFYYQTTKGIERVIILHLNFPSLSTV